MLLGDAPTAVAVAARVEAPSRSERWGLRHVPALDGLRGAAVVAVLLYHAGYLDGGYLGVDLFFVLSGYLITSLLLGEVAATGEINLPGFWARRMRRLLPALLVLLAGVAVYAVLVARPVDLTTIRRDGLATLFYTANWSTILRGTSYWDISLAPSPLQHTWSLAIEEQFYLLWPLVVVGIARWRPGEQTARAVRNLCLVLAPLSAVLFVGLKVLLDVSHTRVYEGTDTRAAALLLGAGWAAHRLLPAGRRLAVRRWLVRASGAAAGLALLVAWFRLGGESVWLYRGGLPLCSLLATAVIVAVTVEDDSSPLARVLAWRPLCGIGLISYGLYLWHWPLYQVLDEERTNLDGLALLAVRLGASVAAAFVSYKLLEMPIRRDALRGRLAHLAIPVTTAVAAVAMVVSTRGAVDTTIDLATAVRPVAGKVPGAPVVTFVGDSVGLSVVNHVAGDPEGFGVNPRNHTWIGCSPLAETYDMRIPGVGEPGTPTACHDKVMPGVVQGQPDLVVVLFGAGATAEMQVGGEWVRPCDPAYDRAWTDGYEDYVREVSATGAQVVVVTVPFRDPRTARVWLGPSQNDGYACQNEGLAEVVERVPDTHLLDLNDLVCPGGRNGCVLEVEGLPIRSDGLHFDKDDGGRLVAEWIVERSLDLGGLEPVLPAD